MGRVSGLTVVAVSARSNRASLKHAGPACAYVTVTYTEQDVTIDLVDDGLASPQPGDGYGWDAVSVPGAALAVRRFDRF